MSDRVRVHSINLYGKFADDDQLIAKLRDALGNAYLEDGDGTGFDQEDCVFSGYGRYVAFKAAATETFDRAMDLAGKIYKLASDSLADERERAKISSKFFWKKVNKGYGKMDLMLSV